MHTHAYGMSREELLKSEALLTLSLKASFEAHSASTLHGERKNPDSGGVDALCIDAAVLIPSVVWHLSRPNHSLQRTLRAVELER